MYKPVEVDRAPHPHTTMRTRPTTVYAHIGLSHTRTNAHMVRTHNAMHVPPFATCILQARDFEWELGMSKTPNNSTKQHDMGDFIAGTAMQQVERLTFKPKQAMLTDVWFTVLDRDTGEVVAREKTVLVTSNKTAGAAQTADVLVIGDSLTSSGEHTQILLNIAQNDSMGLRLIGTRGQSKFNRHEGRGGWTVCRFLLLAQALFGASFLMFARVCVCLRAYSAHVRTRVASIFTHGASSTLHYGASSTLHLQHAAPTARPTPGTACC